MILYSVEMLVTVVTAGATLASAVGGVAAGVWQLRQARQSRELKKMIEQGLFDEEGERGHAEPSRSILSRGTAEANGLMVTIGRNDRLLQEYHTQGLLQSNISFWFSIIFACIGFAIITLGALSNLNSVIDLKKAAVPIVSGGVIDAVAGLFFVQSNRARVLMSEFFDKLRADNNLSESLRLADTIQDARVAANLKAYLSMHFAGIEVGVDGYRSVVGVPGGMPSDYSPASAEGGAFP